MSSGRLGGSCEGAGGVGGGGPEGEGGASGVVGGGNVGMRILLKICVRRDSKNLFSAAAKTETCNIAYYYEQGFYQQLVLILFI